jgi:hypothetical protein
MPGNVKRKMRKTNKNSSIFWLTGFVSVFNIWLTGLVIK